MSFVKTATYAAMALATAATCAVAANNGTNKGASSASPGHQMRDAGGPAAGDHGASSMTPGKEMQDAKAAGEPMTRGASSSTPGVSVSKKN
jgi:Spy/CpxP family protein refolding chaperone